MEIPELIKQRLGDETIESAVSLGDEDLICFTPSRTLLYRGEGLIGNESIGVYDNNLERLNVSEGRRKTGFTLTYVDREEKFSVSRDRGDPVLQRLLQSVLRTAGVIDAEESVTDVYRFSELTVIITDARVVKHVGAYVWDGEYEEYPFAEVTNLDFEEGSVATQIVVSVAGRPQRFKAPNDQAKLLKRSLTNALSEYYEVGSLSQLNDALEENRDESAEEDDDDSVSSDIQLDDSISPLVGDDGDEEEELDTDAIRGIGESPEGDDGDATADAEADSSRPSEVVTGDDTDGAETTGSETGERGDTAGAPTAAERDQASRQGVDREDVEAIQTQLTNLTTAVKRQNELLKEQHETIRKLIDELQRRE
jgi:hypothetical protein